MTSKSELIISVLQKELVELRKQVAYWEIMAMTDDLTGLHNRRLLGDMGQAILNRRQDNSSNEATLLFIDLDDFGKLNKRYGDDVGDEALRVLADGVRQNIRKEDIAIRKGGDEFVIILIGADQKQANDIVAKRIQKMLDGNLGFEVGSDHITIRGSVGVFPYDRDLSVFDNIKNADFLMRQQKQVRKKLVMDEVHS